MAITKELAIASIVITPGTGQVDVHRVQIITEDDRELTRTPEPTLQLQPGDALDGLPLAVQASIAAFWGQDWVQAHTRRVLDELAASQVRLQAEHAAALQVAAERTAELARLAQQQDAQRAALQAAQAELDEERRVLEDRASQVSADRLVIAAQRDHIRKQKPELAVFGGGNV